MRADLLWGCLSKSCSELEMWGEKQKNKPLLEEWRKIQWWSTRDLNSWPPIFIRSELRLCFSAIYAKKYPKKQTSYSEEEPSLLGTKTPNGVNLKTLFRTTWKEPGFFYADSRRLHNKTPYPKWGTIINIVYFQQKSNRFIKKVRKKLCRGQIMDDLGHWLWSISVFHMS